MVFDAILYNLIKKSLVEAVASGNKFRGGALFFALKKVFLKVFSA